MYALMTNIYTTGICQRACQNCYYPRLQPMSLETAQRVILWINRLCDTENVQAFKAHFLGGEPLFNLDIVLYIIDGLSDLPGHTDGKFVLFTNGDLLTPTTLDKLHSKHVRIMLNPTDDSLDRVESKMALVKEICGGISLAVVADNVNLPRLADLARLAVKYHGHIRINRLYHGGTIPGYIENFGEQMHKVFDVLLGADKPMWPNFILESTYPLWPGPANCHACGKWLLVIDPDGTIRSCNADMSTVIGHVLTHRRLSDFVFKHRWTSKGIEECQGCEWSLGGWCQGGCPFTRKLTYGVYNRKTPFCGVYKTLFPRLRELTQKWVEYNAVE